MGIPNSKFREGDVYLKYEFEDVMFHYDSKSKKCFRKFMGDPDNEEEVTHNNKLLNDAITMGEEIDQQEYENE